MTRIAYLVTSAREMTLADGTSHPTGYFAEEALTPYERFEAAGFDVTVITPDGQPPHADPYGLSWFFHYPDEDKDYLASVVRTFARDVDDIRFTLHQSSELGLAAARRVAGLLQAEGRPAAEAHRIVSAAARASWRQDRQFADVLAEDGSLGLTREQIQGAVDAQRADSQRLAAERRGPGSVRRGLRAWRPRAHGRPVRQPRRRAAARRAAPQERPDRGALPRPGGAAVRAGAARRAVALRRLPDDVVFRRGGSADRGGPARHGLAARRGAHERGRGLRRRPRGVGLARRRRPQPHHRAEPRVDRGDRRRGPEEAARSGPPGRVTGRIRSDRHDQLSAHRDTHADRAGLP